VAKSEERAAQRTRHVKEVEESQAALRKSISETGRLVDESDAMLKRHRKESGDEHVPLKATKLSSGAED
jgi:hypothetical protein